MGTEFAQFREWDYESSLEWFMLDYPVHRAFREYVRALNGFYLSSRELWEFDFSERGFEWIYPDEADKNTVVYKRKSADGELIFIVNFSGSEQLISVPKNKPSDTLYTVFESDYGKSLIVGETVKNKKAFTDVKISAFSAAAFRYKKAKKIKKIKENGNVL